MKIMKKLFLILSISIISVLKLTAISVSFSNIEIEQKCYENFVYHYDDLNQGLVPGLITGNWYIFGKTTPLGNLAVIEDYYFNAENFELSILYDDLYQYVGASGVSRITVVFGVNNGDIIQGKEKTLGFAIQQYGSSGWATGIFNISVIPLQSTVNNFTSPICSGSRVFTLQTPPPY